MCPLRAARSSTTVLEGLYRRRSAEHRKVPSRFRFAINAVHRLAIHQNQPHPLYMQPHGKRRVHRHAQRAVVFPTLQPRSICRCASLCRLLRQPLAMDVYRLHRTRPSHQQQACKCQHTQPQRIRVLQNSALVSLGQVFRANERSAWPTSSSMTQIRIRRTPPGNFPSNFTIRELPLGSPSSAQERSQTNRPPRQYPRSQRSAHPHPC